MSTRKGSCPVQGTTRTAAAQISEADEWKRFWSTCLFREGSTNDTEILPQYYTNNWLFNYHGLLYLVEHLALWIRSPGICLQPGRPTGAIGYARGRPLHGNISGFEVNRIHETCVPPRPRQLSGWLITLFLEGLNGGQVDKVYTPVVGPAQLTRRRVDHVPNQVLGVAITRGTGFNIADDMTARRRLEYFVVISG